MRTGLMPICLVALILSQPARSADQPFAIRLDSERYFIDARGEVVRARAEYRLKNVTAKPQTIEMVFVTRLPISQEVSPSSSAGRQPSKEALPVDVRINDQPGAVKLEPIPGAEPGGIEITEREGDWLPCRLGTPWPAQVTEVILTPEQSQDLTQRVADWIERDARLVELRRQVDEIGRQLQPKDPGQPRPAPEQAAVLHQRARQLIDNDMAKHLHDRLGWPLDAAILFAQQTGARYSLHRLSMGVLRQVDPDAAKRYEFDKVAGARERWALTPIALSPFTGEPQRERFGWRDDTVFAKFNRPLPADLRRRFVTDERHSGTGLVIGTPKLVRVPVTVPANGDVTVTVTHSSGALGIVSYWSLPIKTIQPFEKRGPVTVEIVTNRLVTVWPAPTEPNRLTPDKGAQRFELKLPAPPDALSLTLVNLPVENAADRFFEQFREDPDALRDVPVLRQMVTRSDVRDILDAIVVRLNAWQRQRWLTMRGSADFAEQHPWFAGNQFLLPRHETHDFTKDFEWMQSKMKSPVLHSDPLKPYEDDFRYFRKSSASGHELLSAEDIRVIALAVQQLDPAKLKTSEKLGRLFFLCEARIDAAKHLAEFLKLAEANPSLMPQALAHLEHLSSEKSTALPFVLRQFSSQQQLIADPKRYERHNAAYMALCRFQSAESAPLVLDFLQQTTDQLLVQGAIRALSEQTLPELFDRLIEAHPHVAATAVQGPYLQYLELLGRSNPMRASDLMSEWLEQDEFAKHKESLLLIRGRLNDRPLRGRTAKQVNRLDDLRHIVQNPRTKADQRDKALAEMAQSPDELLQYLTTGADRRLLRLNAVAEYQDQPERDHDWAPWRATGEAGVRQLLDVSVNCSLIARYRLAHALSLMDHQHFAMIRKAAFDHAGDADQRRTAIAALGHARDPEACDGLLATLDDENFRSDAIQALHRFDDANISARLQELRRTIEALPANHPRRSIWLQQLAVIRFAQ